jgi:putative drug exporter of the RND superfamily
VTRFLTVPAGRTAKYVVFAVMVLFAMAAGTFAGKFEDAQENETSSFLPGGAESVKALDAVKQFPTGEVANAVTVIASDGGRLGAAEQADAQQLIRTLNERRTELMEESEGPIPSRDGKALLVITPVRNSPDDPDPFLDSVDLIRDEAHQLRGEDVQVEVTGAAGYGADAIKVFGDINGQLLLAAGGLVLILLILIYRSPIFWAIPFFTVLFAEVSSRAGSATCLPRPA